MHTILTADALVLPEMLKIATTLGLLLRASQALLMYSVVGMGGGRELDLLVCELAKVWLTACTCFTYDTSHFYGSPRLSPWTAAATPRPRADTGLLCVVVAWNCCLHPGPRTNLLT